MAIKLLQTKIYPTDDEFRDTARSYFIDNHDDIFKKFKKDSQWTIYYEKNIASQVSFRLYYIN
jgi:hypothetical protein